MINNRGDIDQLDWQTLAHSNFYVVGKKTLSTLGEKSHIKEEKYAYAFSLQLRNQNVMHACCLDYHKHTRRRYNQEWPGSFYL